MVQAFLRVASSSNRVQGAQPSVPIYCRLRLYFGDRHALLEPACAVAIKAEHSGASGPRTEAYTDPCKCYKERPFAPL